jgi:hypothetical protein
MKKLTVGLVGTLLVIMLHSNAWAHSGLRIDLGGNGFGLSVSDGHPGVSVYSPNYYQPYPYYSGYYSNRPYLGWGSYKRHHHHNHHNNKHWGHHNSGHHYKNRNYGHHRGYKRHYNRGGHNQYRGNHRQRNHHRRHWR